MSLWHFYMLLHSGRLTEKSLIFFFFWINPQDDLHFRNHADILIIKLQLCATVLVRVYKTMICLMNLADLCWWLGCFFASCRLQWSWKSHYILLNKCCWRFAYFVASESWAYSMHPALCASLCFPLISLQAASWHSVSRTWSHSPTPSVHGRDFVTLIHGLYASYFSFVAMGYKCIIFSTINLNTDL